MLSSPVWKCVFQFHVRSPIHQRGRTGFQSCVDLEGPRDTHRLSEEGLEARSRRSQDPESYSVTTVQHKVLGSGHKYRDYLAIVREDLSHPRQPLVWSQNFRGAAWRTLAGRYCPKELKTSPRETLRLPCPLRSGPTQCRDRVLTLLYALTQVIGNTMQRSPFRDSKNMMGAFARLHLPGNRPHLLATVVDGCCR